tara:strand:+ start:209 stop:457 length:249 start_codon:yes stop_codon:yes gene_type:complete
MPSKTYLDYKPLIGKAKVGKETKELIKVKHPPAAKFVIDHIFKLQFGMEDYPKVNPSRAFKYLETYKDPKNQGSNGKTSKFQ